MDDIKQQLAFLSTQFKNTMNFVPLRQKKQCP